MALTRLQAATSIVHYDQPRRPIWPLVAAFDQLLTYGEDHSYLGEDRQEGWWGRVRENRLLLRQLAIELQPVAGGLDSPATFAIY